MAFEFPYPKLSQFKSPAELRARFDELGIELPIDDAILSAGEGSPLAQAICFGPLTLDNRWCIHPMEGWDANTDGSPSAHTLRRWRNFGLSGAKLIWGGEAAAVQPDGRANPHQTLALPENRTGLAALLAELQAGHRQACGSLEGLVVGLQLTHSGRFCKPHDSQRFEPRIAYHHPLLDAKFKIDPNNDAIVWTDEQLETLIENYVRAARLAYEVGFQFVDIKACHGYLLHEFLSARSRPGRFGGDFAGRTRLLRTIIERVKVEVPGLLIGVRLSAFDLVPFQTSREIGQPMLFKELLPYTCGFGSDANDPLSIDLAEPLKLLGELRDLGVVAVNVSAGSPYYNPHIQRPASFPPSDGYQPPEDPLLGVARQFQVTRQCKLAVPDLLIVGTGYSYLQDYLPHVAQALVRRNWVDVVGLGRMVLSYPEMPLDTLAGQPLARKRVCRTFSDCTTAPRAGMISGCFPLDPYYKALPEASELKKLKQPQ
jgi:NADPH2 dehydrogenase